LGSVPEKLQTMVTAGRCLGKVFKRLRLPVPAAERSFRSISGNRSPALVIFSLSHQPTVEHYFERAQRLRCRVATLITALGVGAAAGDSSPPYRTYCFNGRFPLVPDRSEPIRHSVLRNVSAIQHKQTLAFAPCLSRVRTCNADDSQQLDEFFTRIPKCWDKKGFRSLSFMYERQSPTTGNITCQTRRDAYTTRTAAPASHPAASLPYASMQSAAPMPAPPPGEVFLCPHIPRTVAYPVPFNEPRFNDSGERHGPSPVRQRR